MNVVKAVSQPTMAMLLEKAKAHSIVGRHKMTKQQLVVAIETKEREIEAEKFKAFLEKEAEDEYQNMMRPVVEKKPKSDYIASAIPGVIVAFKVDETHVLSGIIEEVCPQSFIVRTKNGTKFTVKKSYVIWVKTGPRWPRGVYLALKGETGDERSRDSGHSESCQGNRT